MDRDIFISYIEEDGAVARALASELRSVGPTTWTYEEDGVPGISYLSQVHEAIEGCRVFVLLASPKSVKAHQVIREVEQAHEQEKIIIAVRLDLTHQQFIALNPILRMASGTAVTLAAEKGNLPAVAKRIVDTLRFAEPQTLGVRHQQETPAITEPRSSLPAMAAEASQASSMGQSGSSNVVAAPRSQESPPAPPSAAFDRSSLPDIPTKQRKLRAFWARFNQRPQTLKQRMTTIATGALLALVVIGINDFDWRLELALIMLLLGAIGFTVRIFSE